eukprot:3902833-Pleurochrysis_carterae.AAC.2
MFSMLEKRQQTLCLQGNDARFQGRALLSSVWLEMPSNAPLMPKLSHAGLLAVGFGTCEDWN